MESKGNCRAVGVSLRLLAIPITAPSEIRGPWLRIIMGKHMKKKEKRGELLIPKHDVKHRRSGIHTGTSPKPTPAMTAGADASTAFHDRL